MDDMNDNEIQNPELEPEEEEYELSHTDKLVGIFTEPGNVFTETAKFPPKLVDWLLPVFLMIIVAALANFLMMSNPKIKYEIQQQQMDKIEKSFDEMVEKGQMTQEQADQQLDTIRERMDEQMAAGQIIQIVGMFIVIFVIFFIVAGAFFIVSKFILKGDGSYSSAMVGYGLPYYIVIIQIIVMVILALAMDKFFSGTSVADFLGSDKSTLTGFFLGKLDIFSIWFYAMVSIGLAKMFKSEETGKYFAAVFGMWIGFGLIFHFLAEAVPFLRWFGM